MTASVPDSRSRLWWLVVSILVGTAGCVLAGVAQHVVRLEGRVNELEGRARQSTRAIVLEQEGELLEGTGLHANKSGYVEFEQPFDASPIITVFEKIPQSYLDLVAKEKAQGITKYGFPGQEETYQDRLRRFEKRMLEFGGKFRFTPTGSGFGWSTDASGADLPPNPFPTWKEDGMAEMRRPLRWRARGIKVVAGSESN